MTNGISDQVLRNTQKRYFINIDYLNLAGMITKSAHFQKLSVRNITVSNKALRARSYEAYDLVGLFSSHAAGRSVPYYFKVKDKGSLKSITTNSNRVTEYSPRKGLDQIVFWINEQIKSMKRSNTHEFLKVFAKPVDLKKVLLKTKPSGILIESSRLFEMLEEDCIEIFYTSKHTNKRSRITERLKSKLINWLSKVYDIEDLVIQGIRSSKLTINENSLTFNSFPFHRFTIEIDGKIITLQRYIIRKELYSICFEDPKYIYFMNSCFEDVCGVSEIDSILDIFHPIDRLTNVTSEKGKISSSSLNFEPKSIFNEVEAEFKKEDYIFCDDLGNEWADHITFNMQEPSISFIHSKFGETSTSASNLHDVVGQAIKNLGNMYFTPDDFMLRKKDKLIKTYNQSDIIRLRQGNRSELKNHLCIIQRNPQLYRKCILVCSFISKNEITNQFNSIKKGKKVKGNITQLLWIVSSFVHAAKEMNVIPVIYSKP
ncbi:hypothetical protein [Legionella qingyii]|uniref:hypothetical protein n=1 Tax=Legionella qingyii TaxID=2184757 RepID=UPI000F8EAE4D|nr:hypothetical protein [Legionella qingyii]RUR23305.1 hypothetical protein ELY16_13215 [Legionella qingyii]